MKAFVVGMMNREWEHDRCNKGDLALVNALRVGGAAARVVFVGDDDVVDVQSLHRTLSQFLTEKKGLEQQQWASRQQRRRRLGAHLSGRARNARRIVSATARGGGGGGGRGEGRSRVDVPGYPQNGGAGVPSSSSSPGVDLGGLLLLRSLCRCNE
jgi:hypothetical protein